MTKNNRGWYGDSEGHAAAGRQSSGNTGNPQQHAKAGAKGGKARHPRGRGLQNADQNTRERVAREGGNA